MSGGSIVLSEFSWLRSVGRVRCLPVVAADRLELTLGLDFLPVDRGGGQGSRRRCGAALLGTW